MKDISRGHRGASAPAASVPGGLFALATWALALLGAGALPQSGRVAAAAPAASAMKPAITISNYSFQPATLTIRKGATVTWLNNDDDVHTIKATDGPASFISPALDNGTKFSFTFQQAGTYHYVCTVHPYMRGVIVVR